MTAFEEAQIMADEIEAAIADFDASRGEKWKAQGLAIIALRSQAIVRKLWRVIGTDTDVANPTRAADEATCERLEDEANKMLNLSASLAALSGHTWPDDVTNELFEQAASIRHRSEKLLESAREIIVRHTP